MVLAAALVGFGLYGPDGDDRTVDTGSRAPDTRTAVLIDAPSAPRPYIGKPRAPVKVVLAQDTALAAGVLADLWLEVRTAAPVTDLELLAEGNDGLAVIDIERLGPASAVRGREADQLREAVVARYRVGAVPVGPGEGSLSGLVRFTIGGVEQAAPFRIPVLRGVGKPSVVPATGEAARVLTDAGGERLAVLPAETDVHQGPAR